MGIGSITPHILNIDTRLHIHTALFLGNISNTHYIGDCGHQNQCGSFGEVKDLLPLI